MNTLDTIKQAAKAITHKQHTEGYQSAGLHQYTDTNGNIQFVRLRMEKPDGEKWIRPLSRDEVGNWTQLKEPTFENGKPLYQLHRLANNPDQVVFIVEGEKCADALIKLGLLATTSGGASSVNDADWQILSGRKVIIWADNDPAGLQYANDVATKLTRINANIKHIDIDALNLPPKGDCVDWLQQFKQTHGRNAEPADIEALALKLDAIQSPTSDYLQSGDITALPEPLPSLPSVLPFDYDYLPDGLRSYVQDISERMQCPPDFAAVGVMVMMATIIGRKVGIRPMKHNDWTVIPNLWGAVVGNSGVMKSPTLSAALSPIKKLQAAAYEVFNKARAEAEANAEIAKLNEVINKSKAKALLKRDSSANVKNLLQSDGLDEDPILKRYVTNNASYEALGELLIENTNGLMVEADEIIGLLKQLDASGQEVARSFYLTAADGDKPYTFDRIMRGKGLHIPAVCLSVIGGIQPGVLAEYVRQATNGGAGADGLLQRFGLMVYPDISTNWKEVDRYPDKDAKHTVNQLAEWLDSLNPLIDITSESDDFSNVPFMRFDDEAQILFSEWRATLEIRLRSGDEHPAIVSHLSKYRKLIPSLALINHLCEYGKGAITEKALLRAIAYSEYLESHARRIYSSATRPDIDAAKTILSKLNKARLSSPFTTRDVYRNNWTSLDSQQKAQSAIDLLTEYNHLTVENINTGGRPTAYYHWNSEVKS